MIPKTTEERTAEYTGTATPEFQAACDSVDRAAKAIPQVSPFTSLQQAARRTILRSVPQDIEHTCIALFDELQSVIRTQQETIENHEKWSEFRTHNAHMRAKLGALMQIVAPIVGETYSPTSTDRASELFIADRITSKICHLLAPVDPQSTDVSVEPPRRKFQPWTAPDHNRAVAAIHGVSIPVRDEASSDLTPVYLPNSLTSEEEIRELRYQNAELSRQLARSNEQLKQVSEALQPYTALKTWPIGDTISAVVATLVDSWLVLHRASSAEQEEKQELAAVQKERDELGELLSDIKVVLAKHLSDDPLFNVVPVAEIIDQKLAHLQAVSEKAHRLEAQEARIVQQEQRLRDAGLITSALVDLAETVTQLTSFRLGAYAAQKQKDAEHAPAPVEASLVTVVPTPPAPAVAVRIPESDAVIRDKRNPFVKADGLAQFRNDNPTVDWLALKEFDVPVPIVKSVILMAGGQDLHISLVGKQLSLLPDAATAIGRAFGVQIGMLRDGTGNADDVDEALAKRLETKRVVWPTPEGA